ncbi:DUF1690 domain-containing protein [Drechmeria coniospora]|uniref:DUF1690 domain-containing protein n=1 Tax=Drechmeria coniospora TaxID=98403 RepID=A0A151GUY7_DRECN|nr:DUF1690 domain-containing protein [Drechmeria coniospora]KYK60919.1 DUF1690 domain-containing protein [Drechmeria coniospora]
MGANTSKQDARAAYEWKSASPPSLSLDVLESLQSSPEVPSPAGSQPPLRPSAVPSLTPSPQTDASRARLVERHVQARVAEELEKLQRRESEALGVAHDKIASRAAAEARQDGPSRASVGREVDELRRKLEERKTVRALPDAVEDARGAVVRCLRENDRRPLDCWQEVESFKAEVKKLERSWVDRVAS